MNWLRQLSIKWKLNLVVGITCLAVLAPMFVAVALYQVFGFRQRLARETTILATMLARNVGADLALHDQDGASEALLAVGTEPSIAGACLYNAQGVRFAQYMRPGAKIVFPARAPPDDAHFEPDSLAVSRPVILQDKRIGTIYLQASLQAIRDRLLLSAAVGFPLLAACVLAALALASQLQRPISQPILALTETAKLIAQHHDYSVRAAPQGQHEIGLLTEAFNLMLQQIQEQSEATRESEERFRLMVSSVKDYAIFGLDASGKVATWNAGAKRMLGYDAKEIIGRDCSSFYTREDAERGKLEALLASVGAEDRFEEEDWRVRKDGSRFWASVTLNAVRNTAGRLLGFVKVMRDVTERKEAEAALSHERDRLHTQLERLKLLDQITRAVGNRQDLHSIFRVVIRRLEDHLPVDFACACVYDTAANALVVASVGVCSEGLARSMSMTEKTMLDIDQNGLARYLRGQLIYDPDASRAPFPLPQRLAAGGLRSVVCAPLQVESQVFGVLVAARLQPKGFSSADCEFLKQLSEHVALAAHQARLYDVLQQAFDDLRQTQQTAMQQERLRALGQMASGIAHDINNAIAPVSLYTESLLETEELSSRARGYLQTIQRSIEDVALTVARMREFYSPREPQLTFAAVEINVLVQQVIDLSRPRWSDFPQKRGAVIQLATELAPDAPTFQGVESEIREALVNLIFNAVDAMPDGGTLTLRTKVATNESALSCLAVEVCDTGLGMDEETRRRCLEPFFTTKGERGSGLGLAMVYGIVQRHSGDIEINSAPGQGTVMRLLFPIGASAAEPGKPAAGFAPAPRQRILIVDDDPLLIRSLRDALETDGHTVVSAHSGQEGIDTFRAACAEPDSFTVVFTDLGMATVDGWKVAGAVKAVSPSTPVILLTGWGERLLAEGELLPHVDLVLSKPPKLRDLRQALSRCLSPAASRNTHG